MSIRILKERNKIGFLLSGNLDENDFLQVIRNIELVCEKQDYVHLLFETDNLKVHEFELNIRESDLFKKYSQHIRKIVVVNEDGQASFISDLFKDFHAAKLKVFGTSKIEEAMQWLSEMERN